ncbi:unnamed protein product, partial [Chrysoparadoxa australica]
RCPVRARLTPSLPAKTGALWYHVPVPTLQGFETLFTFQITDQSKTCSEHLEPFLSSKTHTSCSVRGGDGLAFVIHRNDDDIETVGSRGGGLGYGGVNNSLAVEFDTWYNPDPQVRSGDLLYDHVSIHSCGRQENFETRACQLGVARPHKLAEGNHHLVKISRYYPHLETKYVDLFTSSDELLPFLMDNGESRRVGTLVVWMDEGVADDEPLLAIPLNLSVLLDLPQDAAFVGFTAGTGRAWAKHDVLSWYWCHEGSTECGDTDSLARTIFDY